MKKILVMALLVGLLGVAQGQEKKKDAPPPDLMTRIKTTIGEDKPFTLVVNIKIKESAREKFLAQAKITAAETLKEKGCKAYEFHERTDKPGTFILFEKWDNMAALKNHMELQHTKDVLKVFGEAKDGDISVDLYAPK